MFLKLEFLCNSMPVCKFLDGRINTKEFTKELNHWIHGYGEWGYEESAEIDLMTDKQYSLEDAEELLRQIQVTMDLSKDSLYITELDKVPFGIANELANEAGGGASTVTKARTGNIAYGVMHGYELVGFVSAKEGIDVLCIGGLFVYENYRKKGLSIKLLDCLMHKAEHDGLSGLWMGNASLAGQGALSRLKKYYDKIGKKSEFETFDEDLKTLAGLYVKKVQK